MTEQTKQKPTEKKTKKRSFPIILGIIFSIPIILLAISYVSGRGSGNIITETKTVSEFSKISLSGVGNLTIEQSDTESLEIEAEDNIIEKLDIQVVNKTLKIGYKKVWFWNIWPTKDINFHITAKNIEDIKISGSGSVVSESLKSDNLNISINGSGEVDLKTEAQTLNSTISGSGTFNISGTATDQTITINGSGDYLTNDLKSKTATVNINGSGKVELSVSDELDVRISGSGDVKYSGQPIVTQDVSGSGKIEQVKTTTSNKDNTSSDTTNSKTYKNETYKFAINYPSDWKYSEKSYKDFRNKETEINEIVFSPEQVFDINSGVFSIKIYRPKSDSTLETFLNTHLCFPVGEGNNNCSRVSDGSNSPIGSFFNQPVKKLEYHPVVHFAEAIVAKKDGYFYEFNIDFENPVYKEYHPKPDELRDTFNQILSTFKILD